MKRAATLVETLVVIGLIAVLSVILTPALSHTVEQGRKTSCVNNLRQIHLALSIYREEHDGVAEGSASQMAYPKFISFLVTTGKLDPQLTRCSRTPNEYIQNRDAVGYILMAVDRVPPATRTDFAAHVSRMHDAAVEVVDVNHKLKTTDLQAPLTTKHGFGVTVGGSIVSRTKPGDWGDLRWWE